MDSVRDDAIKRRVAPFGDLRIKGCSHLPGAFRRVLRPSSPLDAKASTKCPSSRLRASIHAHEDLASPYFWIGLRFALAAHAPCALAKPPRSDRVLCQRPRSFAGSSRSTTEVVRSKNKTLESRGLLFPRQNDFHHPTGGQLTYSPVQELK